MVGRTCRSTSPFFRGWLRQKITKHGEIVSPDYVRARMDFRLFKVAPLAVLQAGFVEEVAGLGGTLLNEIAKTADDIWLRVYEGVTSVTHKALSPLRTLHQKLVELSFV